MTRALGRQPLHHIPHRRVIPPPTARRWHLPLVQLARDTGQRQALALQLGDDGLKRMSAVGTKRTSDDSAHMSACDP